MTENNRNFLELSNADNFSFLVIHCYKPLSKVVGGCMETEKIEIIPIINYSCCFEIDIMHL